MLSLRPGTTCPGRKSWYGLMHAPVSKHAPDLAYLGFRCVCVGGGYQKWQTNPIQAAGSEYSRTASGRVRPSHNAIRSDLQMLSQGIRALRPAAGVGQGDGVGFTSPTARGTGPCREGGRPVGVEPCGLPAGRQRQANHRPPGGSCHACSTGSSTGAERNRTPPFA